MTNASRFTAFVPAADVESFLAAIADARARVRAGVPAEVVVFAADSLTVCTALLDLLERLAAAPTYLLRLPAPGVERLSIDGVDVLFVRGGKRPASNWHRDADAVYVPELDEGSLSACRARLTTATRIVVLHGGDASETVHVGGSALVRAEPARAGKLAAWRLAHGRSAAKAPAFQGDVLIVGAGLAGALTAYSLHERGVRAAVVDAGSTPGAGASALFAGIAHPHRQSEDSPAFQLTRAGVAKMERLLEVFPDCAAQRGVLDLAVDALEWRQMAADEAAGRPFRASSRFSRLLSAPAASERLGYPTSWGGWFYESGRVVRIGRLVRSLFEFVGASVLCGVSVRLERRGGRWHAVNAAGQSLASGAAVVCAAGMGSPELLGVSAAQYGLSALYGRISLLRDSDLPRLRVPAAGRGYIVRTSDGFTGAGATYEPDGPILSREAAHARNLSVLSGLLRLNADEQPAAGGFYEGVRAVARDRLPIAGPMVDHRALSALLEKRDGRAIEARQAPVLPACYGLFGLGSRGLSWGLALSEALAAEIVGASVPMLPALWSKVSPARFVCR